MGGTSFDVSLVVDGEPDVSTEASLEGFPLLMPVVNIHTIGAGGGSIAYAEAGGLRVGPESAGADPGPACYGQGGTRPTVTDANLVLGRVDPGSFAGGQMALDVDAAHKAVGSLASELGLDTMVMAEGICDVINAKMAQAIRTLTVEKGIEPRDFALVAFGGAGPMHAPFLAQELDVSLSRSIYGRRQPTPRESTPRRPTATRWRASARPAARRSRACGPRAGTPARSRWARAAGSRPQRYTAPASWHRLQAARQAPGHCSR
jgi:N-methylhydantoinase A/oxoprolinase/acetone carboxylase beta subunit